MFRVFSTSRIEGGDCDKEFHFGVVIVNINSKFISAQAFFFCVAAATATWHPIYARLIPPVNGAAIRPSPIANPRPFGVLIASADSFESMFVVCCEALAPLHPLLVPSPQR